MKSVWLAIVLFLAPLSAKGETTELTLNCSYESVSEVGKHETQAMSGSFSAIVRMTKASYGDMTIEATTMYCVSYVGQFSELEVTGECKRTLPSGEKIRATFTVNRISGAFDHTLVEEGKDRVRIFDGRCSPAKKLF